MPCSYLPSSGWKACIGSVVTTVNGVASADSLCLFHWEQKYGQPTPGTAFVMADGSTITVGGGGTGPAPPVDLGVGVDFAQAGFYYPPTGPFLPVVGNPLAANRAYYGRVVPPSSQTITKIRFIVHAAATADDACDVGILSGDMLTLLGSSGSTTGRLNSTGLKEVALAAGVPLVGGQVYYAAVASGTVGGTAAQLLATNLLGAQALFAPNAPPQSEQRYADSKFPLAAGVGNGATNLVPVMALMQ